MRNTDVRIRELTGSLRHPDDHFQQRQRSPMDIYPEATARDGRNLYKAWNFIIRTDDGITGIARPINGTIRCGCIEAQLRPLLMGRDPFPTKLLRDRMYRSVPQGRKGFPMLALIWTKAKSSLSGFPIGCRILTDPARCPWNCRPIA